MKSLKRVLLFFFFLLRACPIRSAETAARLPRYCLTKTITPTTIPLAPRNKAFLRFRGGAPADPPGVTFPEDPYDHETVQERVDAWRRNQQDLYSHMTPEQVRSPRDLQGRVKLLTTVSRGSRALIFFILMWRDVHLYEVADQSFRRGLSRLFVVTPLVLLFLGNMAGVVASLTSPTHSAKKRMKAILNLDKAVELLLIVYNVMRLMFASSSSASAPESVPREVYIANTLHSVFFLLQSQAFTRLTWDEAASRPSAPPIGTTTRRVDDDRASSSAASGVNPYSSYYGATEYAAKDEYRQYEQVDQGVDWTTGNPPQRMNNDRSRQNYE